MNSNDLMRKLKSVGKQRFVEYFDLFQMLATSKVSSDHVVETLVDHGVGNEAGSRMRAGNAKLIFEYNKELEALEIVAKSHRLPASTVNRARELREQGLNFEGLDGNGK